MRAEHYRVAFLFLVMFALNFITTVVKRVNAGALTEPHGFVAAVVVRASKVDAFCELVRLIEDGGVV